jgi:hypothetical protein
LKIIYLAFIILWNELSLKKFFTLGSRNSVGYSPLLELNERIGGWPTINNSWKSSNYEWEEAFIKLTKIKLFLFMRIEVINDLKNTNRSIIKVSQHQLC